MSNVKKIKLIAAFRDDAIGQINLGAKVCVFQEVLPDLPPGQGVQNVSGNFSPLSANVSYFFPIPLGGNGGLPCEPGLCLPRRSGIGFVRLK
jgi:hypothetical protein